MNFQLYFRLIQFSLGVYDGKEFLSGEALRGFDWDAFHRFAKRQTLVGVLFEGIQRLPKEVLPDTDLIMTWFGQCQRIKRRNVALNEATALIYHQIREAGYRCCILKGQGNALMYPNPFSRTPGDVDVWVNASRENIRRLALSLAEGHGSVGEESLNHIEMTWDGIAVELHSAPAVMNHPIHHRRLQKWLKRNADLQCSNIVSLPDGSGNVTGGDAGEIAVPTNAFNVIYQLFHLYHHYFYEGVGLRQIVDYYLVIKSLPQMSQIDTDFDAFRHRLKYLGLWKFAGAVMYVLHEVLGLSEDRMIRPMDEKRGRMLLEEILAGGNFGQHDGRYGFGHGAIGHNLQRLCRDGRLVKYYPSEALSEPIFRIWHFFWRKFN